VGNVDQYVQDNQSRGHGSADHQNAAHVANYVAVLLGSAGGKQALATGPAGSRDFSGSAAFARPRSAGLGGAFLGDDLGFDLGSSGLFGLRKRSRRTRRGSRVGSSGMPLARTVRSTSALGHVL
jgi:hypothetical protein